MKRIYKLLSLVTTIAMLTMLFAGCGGEERKPGDERIRITIWTIATDCRKLSLLVFIVRR